MKKTTSRVFYYTILLATFLIISSCNKNKDQILLTEKPIKSKAITDSIAKKVIQTIDTADYDKRMLALANNDTTGRWPAKAPRPLPGAILPYNRIISYYGNLYSKRMGILGELPKKEMLKKLQSEVARWQAADSTVKAIPALH